MAGKISRKGFLKKSTLGLGAVALATSCKQEADINTPNINLNRKYQWKMVTTWPPNFPVLGEGATKFAEWVSAMSGGRLEIKVYGGGELIPALEVFDAVSSGAAEAGSGASYYWAGKDASLQFFTTVPFGMNAQQVNAWMYGGGGLEIWQSAYEKYNLVPMPGGNTGVQMAGWFNRSLDSIDDFKGLKMRIPGLGGKVLSKVGGTPVLSSGSEIFTNLERGVIDATEWIGPYHDYQMGFHKIAKYYYGPGWHEPGSNLELMFNKRIFDQLPKDLKAILRAGAAQLNIWALSQFEAKNNFYLQKIIAESDAAVRTIPKEILTTLKRKTEETMQEIVDSDEKSKKIFEAYSSFRKGISSWNSITEKSFHNLISY